MLSACRPAKQMATDAWLVLPEKYMWRGSVSASSARVWARMGWRVAGGCQSGAGVGVGAIAVGRGCTEVRLPCCVEEGGGHTISRSVSTWWVICSDWYSANFSSVECMIHRWKQYSNWAKMPTAASIKRSPSGTVSVAPIVAMVPTSTLVAPARCEASDVGGGLRTGRGASLVGQAKLRRVAGFFGRRQWRWRWRGRNGLRAAWK
mmetsp:Transcript_45445/g.125402  ORF Transcript_45445/g.125402 Transcript_45445/m.125402 type:complete len:205 (+) Transcript_45445:1153-1767(+)